MEALLLQLDPVTQYVLVILFMSLGSVFIVDWATVGTRWKCWLGHLFGGIGAAGALALDGAAGVGVWLIIVGLMHWVAAERRAAASPPPEAPPIA